MNNLPLFGNSLETVFAPVFAASSASRVIPKWESLFFHQQRIIKKWQNINLIDSSCKLEWNLLECSGVINQFSDISSSSWSVHTRQLSSEQNLIKHQVCRDVALLHCSQFLLFIADVKKWQMTTTFFFFLSKVFTLVSSATSHLKEDKISFAEKNILPSKLHVF